MVACAWNKMAKVSGLCTISQLASLCLCFEKLKGRSFMLVKKSDWVLHVTQKNGVDVRSVVQRPECVSPEAWQGAEAIESAVCYMIYKMYSFVSTLITKTIMSVK